jgi:hypothetical protein
MLRKMHNVLNQREPNYACSQDEKNDKYIIKIKNKNIYKMKNKK